MAVPWKRKEIIGDATLYLGDCLEILPHVGEVDLVAMDPPYGKVRGDFDDAWTNRAAMLVDCARWRDVVLRAMKFNATLYWFAWPSLAGRIEALCAEKLNPLAHIVWKKPAAFAMKASAETLRAPIPETERVLMFEHYGADNRALGESGYQTKCDEVRGFVFEPLRAYLAGEWLRAGLTPKQANEATGSQMAGHYFTSTQWTLPTREKYKALRDFANREGGDYLRREYDELRREYDELRREYDELRREYDELRRYFDCRNGDQKTDIWSFSPERNNYGHPTVKPVAIMEYIVRLSCRPGGTAMDCFMGSGTTGVACANLGRKFIGIEIEERYFDIACERIAAAYAQGRLFE